jgi:hypothetical protein
MRMRGYLLLMCAACFAQAPAPKQVTWTGWFADEGCARGRLSAPVLTQTNPECARQCIDKGAAAVFISEQAHAIYKVKDYASVVNDLGYRLELTGKLDETDKTISVQTVKRISEYQGAACARPRKKQ